MAEQIDQWTSEQPEDGRCRPFATDRQVLVLRFIHESVRARGFPPTMREIGQHMQIRSTNGVNDHLRALERKGMLSRTSMKSRGYRLTVKGLGAIGSVPSTAEVKDLSESDMRMRLCRQQRLLIEAAGLLEHVAPVSPVLDAIRKELEK